MKQQINQNYKTNLLIIKARILSNVIDLSKTNLSVSEIIFQLNKNTKKSIIKENNIINNKL